MNEWLGREITSLNLHSSIVNTEKIHGCHLLNVTEKLCKSAMNCRNGEIKDITSPRKLLHDEEFTSKFRITQRNFHIHLKKSLSMLLKSIEGQSHLPAVVVSHTADCQKKYEKKRDEELGMSINVGKFFFSLLSASHYSRFDDVRHTIKKFLRCLSMSNFPRLPRLSRRDIWKLPDVVEWK